MSTRPILLAVLAAIAFASLAMSDEERIIPRTRSRSQKTTEKLSESTGSKVDLTDDQKVNVIRDFFAFEGVDISSDFKNFDLYDSDVVEKMQEVLDNRANFMLVYRLNSEINSMIHEAATKRVNKVEPPMELADEATLQALDLIVPNSESQPIFELAKKDLREFYLEQPMHGRELLERLEVLLDSERLHTVDAITQLEGFYYQWAPLGRLASYIQANAKL